MEIFIVLIVVIACVYFGFFYESNHVRHMRRIRECREDWRKDNNGIITPKNIEKEKDSESINPSLLKVSLTVSLILLSSSTRRILESCKLL